MEEIRSQLERYCRTWRGDPGLRVTGVSPIPQGHSGFTYYVDVALDGSSERYVMRLPPPGARIAGPADVLRQGRIMAALNQRGLPAPAVPVICPDPVIDGRPFILAAVIDGVRIEETAGRYPDRDIAESAVDVLRRLHAVPLDQTGIGDEEPQPLEAEMMRWAWLMERGPEELTGRAPVLGGMLAEQRPEPWQPVMVHGDFHYGNMLFREGKVVALLDWEIAQIGQPLLDLACLSVVARASQQLGAGSVPGGGNVVVPQELLVEAYGAPAQEFDWYLALTFYKYAAIFGYNLMLHRRGKRPDPIYEERTGTIVGFIEEGISILDRGRR